MLKFIPAPFPILSLSANGIAVGELSAITLPVPRENILFVTGLKASDASLLANGVKSTSCMVTLLVATEPFAEAELFSASAEALPEILLAALWEFKVSGVSIVLLSWVPCIAEGDSISGGGSGGSFFGGGNGIISGVFWFGSEREGVVLSVRVVLLL
jgi:hypothetical protein